MAVAVKAWVISPGEGQFSEGVEGGGFTEGFLEPFVLLSIGAETGADVGELVCELIDHLCPVAALDIELDDDFASWAAIEESDGTIA